MKVIYIAGPYRAATPYLIRLNIHIAEMWALEVWKWGGVALCPHMNTRLFDGECPDEVWLEGDLELLRRSDAVALIPGWQLSTGTQAEMIEAQRHSIPCFRLDVTDDLAQLQGFLREERGRDGR